jgi:hypothetical protein
VIPRRILFKRILVSAAAALAVLYIGDYLSVRIRMLPIPSNPSKPCVSSPFLRRMARPNMKWTPRILNRRSPASTLSSALWLFALLVHQAKAQSADPHVDVPVSVNPIE